MEPDGTRGNKAVPETLKIKVADFRDAAGVVQLVRTPVTQEAAGSSPVAPATIPGLVISYEGKKSTDLKTDVSS